MPRVGSEMTRVWPGVLVAGSVNGDQGNGGCSEARAMAMLR